MKATKRIIAVILAVVLFAFTLASCANKGKPVMTLDGTELSVNIFNLYLSRMKGTMVSADYLAKEDSYWDKYESVGKTYNDIYTEKVLDTAKTTLASLVMFEQKGLKLPDEKIAEIDKKLAELIDLQAEGSKTVLNTILSEYGVNYEMLREAYIIEAKIDYLADSFSIGDGRINQYYKDNYARFKQVFLYTYETVYQTDANNDLIYFKDNGRIAYDTSKRPKEISEGVYQRDENGDIVYVYVDSNDRERIAYDLENGKLREKLGEDGKAEIREFTDAEKSVIYEDAKEILALADGADELAFDELVKKYNKGEDESEYPDGFYVWKDMNFAYPEMLEEVFKLEVGGKKIVKTDSGYHVIMRYELEELSDVSNKDTYDDIFISNTTGDFVFMDKLRLEFLIESVAELKSRIVVDEKLLATVDIKRAGINYYY